MPQFGGLVVQNAQGALVAIAKGINGNAGDKIEVFLAVSVVQVHALAVGKDKIGPGIVAQQYIIFQFDQFLRIHGSHR